MKSKTDQIRAAWAGGDQIGALGIAARFFDRSDETLQLKRGMSAHNNPDFYRQLGEEPTQIVGKAIEALRQIIKGREDHFRRRPWRGAVRRLP